MEISNSHLRVRVEGGSCIFTPSCSKGFTKYKGRALKVKEKIRVDMHR
jgi:putative component of membrane protein insertase Oxa1/YidC/SpoIIIJ protein YidD